MCSWIQHTTMMEHEMATSQLERAARQPDVLRCSAHLRAGCLGLLAKVETGFFSVTCRFAVGPPNCKGLRRTTKELLSGLLLRFLVTPLHPLHRCGPPGWKTLLYLGADACIGATDRLASSFLGGCHCRSAGHVRTRSASCKYRLLRPEDGQSPCLNAVRRKRSPFMSEQWAWQFCEPFPSSCRVYVMPP